MFFDGKYPNQNELLVDNEKNKTLGGAIFKKENLKNFSVKFYTCLENISNYLHNSFIKAVPKHLK